MTAPQTCIVLTTINSGDILQGYCQQAETEGTQDRLSIIVIPDRKTPDELYAACRDLVARGFDVRCPTLAEQEDFLKSAGPLGPLVPYDSDNRRNIGYLMAWAEGCDVLLSIDDDNYCRGETYAVNEVVCADEVTLPAVHSDNGWFNFCDLMEMQPDIPIYPRGFPYHKRHQPPRLSYREETGRVRLNAGLWLQEPDVDAITWLAAPPRGVAFSGQSLLLGQDTWGPINSQNTALHRDLIPAYYFVRMGYPLAGTPIDRFGDIFSGYLCQACVRHLGDRIRVGTPVVDHRRNAHNFLSDLQGEMSGILVLESFSEWLPGQKLEGDTYPETYLSLAEAIDHQVEHFKGKIWTDATRGFFHQMTYGMRQWIKACRLMA